MVSLCERRHSMALKCSQFTKEFKVQVVHEVQAGKSLAQAAREHELHPGTIIEWCKKHEKYAERAIQGNGRSYRDEAKIAELERMVGQQAMEIARGRTYLTSCPAVIVAGQSIPNLRAFSTAS